MANKKKNKVKQTGEWNESHPGVSVVMDGDTINAEIDTDKMPSDKKVQVLDAIIQEANRNFFHPLGLCIVDDDGLITIVEPEEQPKLNYGENVKEEIANVKAVQEMRIVNCKKRLKELGYKVQPVNTNF